MFRLNAVLLAAAIVGGATVGCSTVGTGKAASSPVPSSSSPSQQPMSIDLSGVDPCRLLTSSQRTQFGLEDDITRETHEVLKAPICSFKVKSVTAETVQVTTDAKHNYERWLHKINPTENAVAAGFRALLIEEGGGGCQIAVDVHDNQELLIKRSSLSGSSQRQVCDNVKQYAAAALQTLKESK